MELRHLSYSAIDDYKKCPYAFKLKRIDKVPQDKLLAGPAGTAFHTMTEVYDLGKHEVYPWGEYLSAGTDRQQAYTIIRGEDYEWWLAQGEKMYKDYVKWRYRTDWDVLGVEVAFDVQLPGLELPLVGYVDRVFEMSDGRKVVVDIKTGFRVPGKTDQLKLYRAALMVDGMDADAVAFYDARNGNSTNLEYPDDTPETIALEIQPIERAILNEEFPPNASAKTCNSCYVRAHCKFSKATK